MEGRMIAYTYAGAAPGFVLAQFWTSPIGGLASTVVMLTGAAAGAIVAYRRKHDANRC